MKKFITKTILTYIRVIAKISLLIDRPTIIGITGSAGKTSTRDAIYAVLKDTYKVHVIKKGNSETGVPLGILGLQAKSIGFDSVHKSVKDWLRLLTLAPFRITFPQKFQYMIIEMGIDDPLPPRNMEYLLRIVQPDIAIVLNAYPVHSEQFEKVVKKPITEKKIVTEIAREKVKLVTHNPRCKLVIYNKDNESIVQFLDEVDIDAFIFGTSTENHISYVDHDITIDKTTFSYKVGSRRALTINIDGYALPDVYREVLAAAILIGEYVGLDVEAIKNSLEKNFYVEPGRSTLFLGHNDSILIDSSYNASRESVLSLVKLAYTLKKQTGRRLAFVFGDMRELGNATRKEHETVLKDIKGKVDYLYTVGPLTKKYVFKTAQGDTSFKDVKTFDGPYEVGEYLKSNMPKNCIVLFKGSQNTIFLEEAVKHVLADSKDSSLLPRQEDYWMRKKHFNLNGTE